MVSLILVSLLLFASTSCQVLPAVDEVQEPPPMDQTSPDLAMTTARAAHTATLLDDGRVLMAGGFYKDSGGSETPIASAELFDPAEGRFVSTDDLNEARSSHTATLLESGKVLIVGGWIKGKRTSTVELYDPVAGEFSFVESLQAPRAGMTATALKDGTILIVGGEQARSQHQPVAERYDPRRGTFMPAGQLNVPRSAHTATLLDDGRVLIVGGSVNYNEVLASVEIYDPATETFSLAGSLHVPRHKHAALRLDDGSVLIAGGSDAQDWRGQLGSSERYDVATGTSTEIASLRHPRFKFSDALVTLPSGDLLLVGGAQELERFSIDDLAYTTVERADDAYYYATATLLNSGDVLIAGGYNRDIIASGRGWIYQP